MRPSGVISKNINFYKKDTKMTMTKLLLFSLIMVFLSGCLPPLREEKITPAFSVERLDSQINHLAPLVFNIPIDSFHVDDEFAQIGNLNNIGGAFRRFFERVADVTIGRQQAGFIMKGPYKFDIDQLDEVDFGYIKDISIKKVRLEIDEKAKKNAEVNFEFIKRLEIYIKFLDEDAIRNSAPTPETTPKAEAKAEAEAEAEAEDIPDAIAADVTSEDQDYYVATEADFEGAYLILSYDNELQNLGCNGDRNRQCLEMIIHRINWKKRLQKNNHFALVVKLQAASAPNKEISFKGDVEVQVDLNLGI